MNNYPLKIEIRTAGLPSDLDYIYSTFCRSLHNQWPWRAKRLIDADDKRKLIRDGVDKNYFMSSAHSIMTRMLRNCNILIACLPDDPDQIFGYLVYTENPRVLYWIYVKWDFRQAGVATRLLLSALDSFDKRTEYVIRTGSIRHLEKKWNLAFNSHHLTRLGRQENLW